MRWPPAGRKSADSSVSGRREFEDAQLAELSLHSAPLFRDRGRPSCGWELWRIRDPAECEGLTSECLRGVDDQRRCLSSSCSWPAAVSGGLAALHPHFLNTEGLC